MVGMAENEKPDWTEEEDVEEEVIEAVRKISPKRAKKLAKHRKTIEKMLTG